MTSAKARAPALDAAALEGLPAATLVLAVLYSFFALTHALFLPASVARVMVPLTAGEALALYAMRFAIARRPPAPARAHAWLAALGALALANSLTLLYLVGEPQQATNLWFLAIGAGFLMLDRRWFAGMIVAILAGLAVAMARTPGPEWTHYVFGTISAIALAALIHAVRARSTTRLDAARALAEQAASDRHNAELLREQNEFKTQFINNTAHELGTPLTPIRIQLSLLERATDEAARARSLGILSRNFDRLARIIDDLLIATRLQGNKLVLEPARVDLAALAREVADSFADVAARQNVALQVDAPDSLVLEAADGDKLHQVFYNLVANALKFSPPGGRVTIEARRDAGAREATVRVRDEGVGVAPQDIAKLFQPFSQLPAGKARGGTGLGLHISRAIVELHGGRIWCESDGEGKGATFGFSVPAP